MAASPDTLPTRDDPNVPCPWCGRIAHFVSITQADLALHPRVQVFVDLQPAPGVFQPALQRAALARATVLNCSGCQRACVVVEQRSLDEDLAGDTIAPDAEAHVFGAWRGVSWWPIPSQGPADPSIPTEVQQPFAEGMRALSVNAPNAAVATFRSALVALIHDRGSEQAKGKRDLKDKLKQFVNERGLGPGLAEWAEQIHLYGNAAAHPEVYGKVSVEEAGEVAALLRSLFDAVYVLPAQIARRRSERMPPGR